MTSKSNTQKPLGNATVIPADIVKQLGKRSDRALEAESGVSVYYLKRMRHALGIAAFAKPEYPDEMMTLLGKITDIEISRRYKVPPSTVFNLREKLSIPRMRKRSRLDIKSLTAPFPSVVSPMLGRMPGADTVSDNMIPLSSVVRKKQSGLSQKPHFKWMPEQTLLLGTMSDSDLSKKLNVSISNVYGKRISLGIPSFSKLELPVSYMVMLGTISDEQLSHLSGVSIKNVRRSRMQAGILPFRQRAVIEKIGDTSEVALLTKEYPDELLLQLGVVEDRSISATFNFQFKEIVTLRQNLKIPRPSGRGSYSGLAFEVGTSESPDLSGEALPKQKVRCRSHIWKDEDIALLGTMDDQDLATKLRTTVNQVLRKRLFFGITIFAGTWSEKNIALLGSMTDSEVANKIGNGITYRAVRKKRQTLKIEACRTPTMPVERKLDERWTEEVFAMLGKFSDYKIAEQAGIDRSSVTMMRQSRRIPAFSKQGKEWPWTDEDLLLLGTDTDLSVAAKIGRGISGASVSNKRRALNILSFNAVRLAGRKA